MKTSIRTPDILKMAGAVIFLIAGLLPWYKIDLGDIGSEDFNAFEWFPTGTLPWLLFLAVGVITALVVFDVLKSPDFPMDRIVLGLAVVGFVLFILRLVLKPEVGDVPEGTPQEVVDQVNDAIGRGFGLWVALVGALLALAGAVMAFLDSNKVGTTTAGSYGDGYGSSSSTPPPPPPSY